jgi:hypothetical protein
MRNFSLKELDAELAEQLPARDLMGGCCHPCGCSGYASASGHPVTVNYTQGSFDGNGNGDGNVGLINVAGIGNGDLDGNNVILGL